MAELEAQAAALEAEAREWHTKAQAAEDMRTPEELLDLIEAKGREVAEALAELRQQLAL